MFATLCHAVLKYRTHDEHMETRRAWKLPHPPLKNFAHKEFFEEAKVVSAMDM